MSNENKFRYIQLGNMLVTLRNQSHLSQTEFASRVKASQQSVSRWERGESRPRSKEFDLIATVLSANVNELLILAGHIPSIRVATYDQPFPINSLTPDSFERFCLHLLDKLYSSSKVHRAGGTGHKQDGLDIEVTAKDGAVCTFQCKRVANFGESKIDTAVKAHTAPADKKYLLLSIVASPQARKAIAKHNDWEIWDKEDISLKIRSLPKRDQIEIVDIFFRGQRQALLGEPEAGPWMTLEDFFSPHLCKDNAFNHKWSLIGRSNELSNIYAAINSPDIKVTFLTGAGGSGKSKLLYQALVKYEAERNGVKTYILSTSEEASNKSLEDLGHGEKLLVIDDAHARDDLPLLFQFAANPKNKTRLLISLRPYGLERARGDAASMNLQKPRVIEIKLGKLSLKESTDLATQVLKEYGGPEQLAENIARLTLDCPLATVMGAQVVSREHIRPELVHNEQSFRTLILNRFEKVIAGEITKGQDIERVTKILKVLALIQPFSIEDQRTVDLIEKIESIATSDSARLIKLLINAGVLFKRGGLYRISPDLLADHIIENNCIDAEGRTSGYAEMVFDIAPDQFIERILLNLSKLDWRRANGDPSNSHLLDVVWGKLESETHVSAMTAVAYYQPARALAFAEKSISEGEIPRKITDLLKYVAYNFDYIPGACACLWELGKSDNRKLNQTPEHAVRILSELCAIEPNKPIEYSEAIVKFGLSLLDNDDAWKGEYTPYDVLQGILRTEGHSTTSNGREFSMSPFYVRQQAVGDLRAAVIDVAIERLSNKNLRVALHSASFLHNALRYPMGQFGSTIPKKDLDLWTKEFIETLTKIKFKLNTSDIASIVHVELIKSINWHAHYGEDATKIIAASILDTTPDTLEYRTLITLIDGFGHQVDAIGYEAKIEKWEDAKKRLIKDLLEKYPNLVELYLYLERLLKHAKQFNIQGNISPYILFYELLNAEPKFAKVILDSALADHESISTEFIAQALNTEFKSNRIGALNYAQRLLENNNPVFARSVAHSLDWIFRELNPQQEEICVLRQLIASNDESVAHSSIHAIGNVAKNNTGLAIELLMSVDISKSSKLANEVLSICDENSALNIEFLGEVVVQDIYRKMLPLQSLDGHWIEKFISDCSLKYPVATARFYMERVKIAATNQDYNYRPSIYGPWAHIPVKFRDSSEFNYLLNSMWTWIREYEIENHDFHREASRLFEIMFKPIDEAVLIFLREKLRGDQIDLQIMTNIHCNLSPDFCFNHPQYIIDYLDRANSFGKEIVKNGISSVYSSTMSGMRSGTPGQPFARDIIARDKSTEILQKISPSSPAHRLFTMIKISAEREIENAFKENEYFAED